MTIQSLFTQCASFDLLSGHLAWAHPCRARRCETPGDRNDAAVLLQREYYTCLPLTLLREFLLSRSIDASSWACVSPGMHRVRLHLKERLSWLLCNAVISIDAASCQTDRKGYPSAWNPTRNILYCAMYVSKHNYTRHQFGFGFYSAFHNIPHYLYLAFF